DCSCQSADGNFNWVF
nr:immunoglobulin light chain junction region [Macaca mulatta]